MRNKYNHQNRTLPKSDTHKLILNCSAEGRSGKARLWWAEGGLPGLAGWATLQRAETGVAAAAKGSALDSNLVL